MLMLQITIHCTPNPFSLFGKIKTCPDPDGTQDRVLGVKLAKNLKVIGSLSAVNGGLGIFGLDSLKLFMAHLFLSHSFSKALASCPLRILNLVTPEDLIGKIIRILKGLA